MEPSVVLTTVWTLGEADVICGLLRTEGIECSFADSIRFSDGGTPGIQTHVLRPDLDRARELIEADA